MSGLEVAGRNGKWRRQMAPDIIESIKGPVKIVVLFRLDGRLDPTRMDALDEFWANLLSDNAQRIQHA